MANSIFKWCKTKILSGYKQINVEGPDEISSGNRSDTEYLVRSSDEEFLLTPTGGGYSYNPSSGGVPEISYSVAGSPKLHFNRRRQAVDWKGNQSVSCNFSLSEDNSERQEFAFTLYDFHGQGKVTKDDIASLVQSIYETVGSSMSLPPSGSRTVKVKLSVAPTEGGAGGGLGGSHRYEGRGQRGPVWNCSTPKESPRTLFNDSCSSHGESPRYYDECWGSSYRTSPNVTPRQNESPRVKDPLSPRQCTFINNNNSPRQSDSFELLSPRQDDLKTPRQLIEAEEEMEVGVTPLKTRKSKKVLYQRQELLQMIQTSMEKNHLYYPPIRNYACAHSRQHSHHRRKKKRSQHQHSGCCGCCRCNCSCNGATQQQRCHGSNGSTLDPATLKARLMHYDNTVNNNELATTVEAPVDVDNGKCCARYYAPNNKRDYNHYRSRSQDLNSDSPHVFRHHLLEASSLHHHPLPPSNTPDRPTSPHVNHQHSHSHYHQFTFRHRSRSCEGDEAVKEESITYQQPLQNHHQPHTRKSGESLTYHCHNSHSKYKANQDHHQAVNEVVTWLEKSTFKDCDEIGREDVSNTLPKTIITTVCDDNANNINSGKKSCDATLTTNNISTDDSASNGTSGCGRSHHVHQHYHHHYHHYPTTPLII